MGEERARGGVFVGVGDSAGEIGQETGRKLGVVEVVTCARAGAVLDKLVMAVGVIVISL